MRALDFGERDEIISRYPEEVQIYPLPMQDLTQPSLSIIPHPAANRAFSGDAGLGNREEVYQP